MRAAISVALGVVYADVHAAVLTGDAQVEDGNTIKLSIVPVRIHAIDAPEDGQCYDLPGGRWSCDEADAVAAGWRPARSR